MLTLPAGQAVQPAIGLVSRISGSDSPGQERTKLGISVRASWASDGLTDDRAGHRSREGEIPIRAHAKALIGVGDLRGCVACSTLTMSGKSALLTIDDRTKRPTRGADTRHISDWALCALAGDRIHLGAGRAVLARCGWAAGARPGRTIIA